jgi:hypothetical protein
MHILLKTFGATAFISATTFASCPRSHMHGREPPSQMQGALHSLLSPCPGSEMSFGNPSLSCMFRSSGVPWREQCNLGHILAITNANKLALEHRLGGTNLGLGVQSSFAFASVASFYPCHRGANKPKLSVVGLYVVIWWCSKEPLRNRAGKTKHQINPAMRVRLIQGVLFSSR